MQEIIIDKLRVEIEISVNIEKIEKILYKLLYVPDIRLKPFIINCIIRYITPKLSDPNYKINVFIANKGNLPSGFVICQIHPTYKSYGRACCVFSWLIAQDYDVCMSLMNECELFARENHMRRLRGPINFPKIIGGMGIQTYGFTESLLSGVAFGKIDTELSSYLQSLGYEKESEYTCLRVEAKSWAKGNMIDDGLEIKYWTFDQLEKLREPILDLVRRSFHGIIPDSSGLDEKFNEMLNAIYFLPPSYFDIRMPFIPENWSNVSRFIECWKRHDIININSYWPTVFDKKTGKLVGILATHPDLFEIYLEGKSTRCNVDTAMIDKEYTGKGIFSTLNNIGQLTCNIHGIIYFEGTHIWTKNSKGVNNQRAIDTIFPHCKPIRKYIIFEKKIKRT